MPKYVCKRFVPDQDGEWPLHAGWYRLSLHGECEPCRAEIWFDFGRGFVRYHSVDLGNAPDCFDRWIIRLFKPPRAIELRIVGCRDVLGLTFERIPYWRIICKMLSEWFGVLVTMSDHSVRLGSHTHYSRPVRMWRVRGLQAFREEQRGRHLSAYAQWRTRYASVPLSENRTPAHCGEWLLVADLRGTADADDACFSVIIRALELGFGVNLIVGERLALQLREQLLQPSNISITITDSSGFSVAEHLNGFLSETTIKWLMLLPIGMELFDDALSAFPTAGLDPHAAIIYSDSEFHNDAGGCRAPLFRHRFSPERLLSQDWLGSLLAVNTECARKVGGWREAADIWLHYELSLRVAALVPPDAFVHIPQILYSEASATRALFSAIVAEVRQEQVNARGLPANAFELGPAKHVPASGAFAGMTTVIIATRDRLDLLRVAVRSVFDRSSVRPNELIIVDNGSTDPSTLEWLAEVEFTEPEVRVLRDPDDFNYSRLNNIAASHARGSVLAFLNNDTEVLSPQWIEVCSAFATHPNVGAVGPLLLYPDGTIQHAGLVTGVGGIAGHVFSGIEPRDCHWPELPMVTRGVSAVTGACLFVEKWKFELVGGFDDKNLAVALNDVDLCLRLEAASFRNIFVPGIQLVHKEMQSRRQDRYEESSSFSKEFDFMRNRWGERLDRDPWCPAPLRFVKGVPELFWAPDNWEAFVGRYN